MSKENKSQYLLVDSQVLPDIFNKVMAAKRLLQIGEFKTVSEVAEHLGISRSAFYKYKDHVLLIEEMGKDRVMTLFFLLLDNPGTLSGILNVLAIAGANILTINQNIPVKSIATMTITFRAKDMDKDLNTLLDELKGLPGVKSVEVIAGE